MRERTKAAVACHLLFHYLFIFYFFFIYFILFLFIFYFGGIFYSVVESLIFSMDLTLPRSINHFDKLLFLFEILYKIQKNGKAQLNMIKE